MATPLQQLVETELDAAGHNLKQSVIKSRKRGDTWQDIAYWIKETTGRTVTAETVRRWYNIT